MGFLSQNIGLSRPIQCALGEIYFLIAAAAHMGSVELIREDFNFLGAIRAFAYKRLEGLEILKPGTMLRCRHNILLFNRYGYVWIARVTVYRRFPDRNPGPLESLPPENSI